MTKALAPRNKNLPIYKTREERLDSRLAFDAHVAEALQDRVDSRCVSREDVYLCALIKTLQFYTFQGEQYVRLPVVCVLEAFVSADEARIEYPPILIVKVDLDIVRRELSEAGADDVSRRHVWEDFARRVLQQINEIRNNGR